MYAQEGARRTGLVWNELYMWHDTGSGAGPSRAGEWIEPDQHGESPGTKRRLRNLLDVSGLLGSLTPIAAREATLEELLRFHTAEYLDRIMALSAAGGGDGGDGRTPFGSGSFEIARLAAGGCIAAVDAVLDGEVDNAYALVRPPGHHAEAGCGRGFCLFGNVALAALHAQHVRGVGRIAIVDWDVHHGNGTQQAFWSDPDVLTVSLHQSRWFPTDSGAVEEVGEGAGFGFNLNVPLPPGSGVAAYLECFDRLVLPALRAFQPELIIVAAGFDASPLDPLGRMMVHSDGYRTMTRTLLDLASQLCEGRIVLCHEGGYSAAYVPFCGLAVIEELAGVRTPVVDPFLARYSSADYQAIQPQQASAIDAAAANLATLRHAVAHRA